MSQQHASIVRRPLNVHDYRYFARATVTAAEDERKRRAFSTNRLSPSLLERETREFHCRLRQTENTGDRARQRCFRRSRKRLKRIEQTSEQLRSATIGFSREEGDVQRRENEKPKLRRAVRARPPGFHRRSRRSAGHKCEISRRQWKKNLSLCSAIFVARTEISTRRSASGEAAFICYRACSTRVVPFSWLTDRKREKILLSRARLAL